MFLDHIEGIWKQIFWWFDVCCPLVVVPVILLSIFFSHLAVYLITDIIHSSYHFSLSVYVFPLFFIWPFRSQTTCLMLAAKKGYSKVINLLMSYGAEINGQDEHGYTVSHSFVFGFFYRFTLFDLILTTFFILQALCLAVQQGRQEAVLKLLELGADQTLRTKTGKCPADLAMIFKNPQVEFFYDTNPKTSGQFTSHNSKILNFRSVVELFFYTNVSS